MPEPRATQGAFAEKGRTVCTAGVEFHVPAWLITCNAVHSETLADGSTDLYGTVVIFDYSVYLCASMAIYKDSGLCSIQAAGCAVRTGVTGQISCCLWCTLLFE
jgi:hypothetical protein